MGEKKAGEHTDARDCVGRERTHMPNENEGKAVLALSETFGRCCVGLQHFYACYCRLPCSDLIGVQNE